MFDLQTLIKEYGVHYLLAAFLLSLVFWVIFISRYMKGREARSTFVKVLDVILMFFYIGLFALYVLGGMWIGETFFGSSTVGVCIGFAAYWFMFQIQRWIKKKMTKV